MRLRIDVRRNRRAGATVHIETCPHYLTHDVGWSGGDAGKINPPLREASDRERLWQGLTDPAFTRRYWQTELHTDWAKGSPVTWNNHGVLISDPESVVLESDPYRRLSYTWHTMTPELAEKFGWDETTAGQIALFREVVARH